jgi:dienelactone hydrolase
MPVDRDARSHWNPATDRRRGTEQGWVFDTLLGLGGWDVIHPECRPFFEELGYYHSDVDMVFSRVKSASMLPKAWAEVAASVEAKAAFYRDAGFPLTARDLYGRASVLWGRAQYSYYNDDPRKFLFRDAGRACVDKLIDLNPTPIERVEIDFDGHTLFGLLHLPGAGAESGPAVILGPGMDTIKEDYTLVAQRYYIPRGLVALAIEGPGQGETLSNGLKVDLTNYERAVSAFIDYLVERPEVDPTRIGQWGMSMGSYWGLRCAATEPRLRVVATALGCYGDMNLIFNRAQPSYKMNFMYMSGYDHEEEFDRRLGSKMNLWKLAPQIECPVFMGIGEFDELTHLEDALALYETIRAPKEICVFGQEFHPLGGVAAEVFRFGAEWIERGLRGEFDVDGRDERRYMPREGEVRTGTASPPWWLGAQPPAQQT